MRPTTCECCGQLLPEMRLGVRMTPLKARIFDLVKARPGISRREIAALIERKGNWVVDNVGSHVAQINDALDAASWRIVGKAHYGYRLVRRVNNGVDKSGGLVYRSRL